MSRYAHRKDGPHPAVVLTFRALGASVVVVDSGSTEIDGKSTRKGILDLVVGYMGRDHWVEVKPLFKANQTIDGVRNRGTQRDESQLRPAQAKFTQRWKGAPPQLVRTPTDVAALLVMWRDQHEKEFRAAKALAAVQP